MRSLSDDAGEFVPLPTTFLARGNWRKRQPALLFHLLLNLRGLTVYSLPVTVNTPPTQLTRCLQNHGSSLISRTYRFVMMIKQLCVVLGCNGLFFLGFGDASPIESTEYVLVPQLATVSANCGHIRPSVIHHRVYVPTSVASASTHENKPTYDPDMTFPTTKSCFRGCRCWSDIKVDR